MSPLWQRQPRIIEPQKIELNELKSGVSVMARTGMGTYWLTTTATMRLFTPPYSSAYVVGIAAHANNRAAPRTSPLYTSMSRTLQVGETIKFGIEGNELVNADPSVISALRVYDTAGVKKPKVRANHIVPSNGVDLAAEEPGTVVMLQTAQEGEVYLTLAYPTTHGPEQLRGMFITRRHGTVPLMTPYNYTATRHIAPGRWFEVTEGEGQQARKLFSVFVGGVSVNGVPRQ